MERFNFSVVLEPDDDKWFACIPEFEHLGVATWGETREEAAKNLLEVAIMAFQDVGKDATELVAVLSRAGLAVGVYGRHTEVQKL